MEDNFFRLRVTEILGTAVSVADIDSLMNMMSEELGWRDLKIEEQRQLLQSKEMEETVAHFLERLIEAAEQVYLNHRQDADGVRLIMLVMGEKNKSAEIGAWMEEPKKDDCVKQVVYQIGPTCGEMNLIQPAVDDAKKTARQTQKSPIYLSPHKGSKIDFIRLFNAYYELGLVTNAVGAKLTKKDYFTALGLAFNIDLSSYDKDLSNSMNSVNFDKQTGIFDALREKHVQIYNSK